MNLIEQLGGYEETKKHLDSCWCDDENKAYLLKNLLEYRRQHNIFEVGDLVISKDGCELVSEITYLQGDFAKIKNERFDHFYLLRDFRHATDAEIKAGHRL